MNRADLVLTQELARYYDDPLGYVMWCFPWHTDPSIQMVPLVEPWRSKYNSEYGPDRWCCEYLEQLGQEIKKRKFNGRDAVAPIRFSTASGHGIGKSTLVSWLILFILDTRPYSMGMVTATTADQLRTKTWAELARWHHLAITSHLWEYSNSQGHMSISRRGDKAVKAKWRCDGLTAKAENAEAFQGLHAANSTPFYIFDEASGVDNKIWEARLGGATDGEPMSFDFGNPTRKSGYFYENCVGQYKEGYIVRQIDSRDVYITNKGYLNELKDLFGEDSDLFGVKVRGVFPNAGSVQFIPSDLVTDAMHRDVVFDKNDPVLIGVDVARFGSNDTVIFTRVGMDAKSIPFKRYNGLDTTQVVDKVIEQIHTIRLMGKNISGLFIDGGGLGAGPVDMLRRLGYNPIDVNFGKAASDTRYRRWGDQMWGNLKDALPRLSLPNNIDLKTQLTQREYDIPQGKITLESKQDMMKRLGDGKSPDIADALVLTFAQTIAYNYNNQFGDQPVIMAKHDYDPMNTNW